MDKQPLVRIVGLKEEGMDAKKYMDLVKDVAYNLRRMVLLNGGGQWLGVRTIKVPPRGYVTIEYVQEMASKMLHIINPNKDKVLWLFNDTAYTRDEQVLQQHSYELYPGLVGRILLEYKEAIYVYNPSDEEAIVKVDQYIARTCYFGL